MHDANGLALLGFKADAQPATIDMVKESCPNWPHVFVKIDADPTDLLDKLHANHVHAVAGDCMAELEMFAKMVGIPFITI